MAEQNQPIISFITPTYNRRDLLTRAYKSLLIQSDKRFEWIIVDDGSIDNTKEIVDSWLKENSGFPIKYFWKENGGKPSALNTGFSIATGEFASIIDSDEYLTEDAARKLILWIDEIKDNAIFAGVAGMRGFSETHPRSSFPKNKSVVDASDIDRDIKGLRGDKQEAYRLELFKTHPFPIFENEKFVQEGPIFWQIAGKGYIVRFYNEIIIIGDYLEDGLTHNINELRAKNFKGYTWYAEECFKYRRFPMNWYSVGAWLEIAGAKGLSFKEASAKINIKGGPAALRTGAVLYSVLKLIKKLFIREKHEKAD